MRPATPRLGDFGVVATGGIAADLIRFGTDSPFNHAFVYVGFGLIVEADPNGAQYSAVEKYPHAVWSSGRIALDSATRFHICRNADALIGTPYGWLDIVAIALAQRRLGKTVNSRTWWARRVQSNGTLICSQLVDVAYQGAGVHLFKDGRLPGLVSPGDLYDLIRPRAVTVKR